MHLKKTRTNKIGFWTECYDKYEEAEKCLRRLIVKFRDSDFEIAPCKGIKNMYIKHPWLEEYPIP